MRRFLLGVTGVVAIAGMLGAAATADAQKRGGTLRVAYGNEILGLDFHTTLYWNTVSGSPFYQVAQPWMKDYVYQAEFKVLYKKVWLDK